MRRVSTFIAFCAALAAAPSAAQEEDQAETSSGPALGSEVWASTDADDTSVIKLTGIGYLDYAGREDHIGVALEKAWFAPQGGPTREHERGYLVAAGAIGSGWKGAARVGTDGHTVLGSVTVRRNDWRQSFFVEREIVETPQGVDRGIYYTFGGASFDFPVDDRNVVTAMVGAQEFTGDNVRLHLRGSYIHVVKPAWGLSAQVRGRYYHSTRPGEFDYFSPRDYVEVLPVLQVRRYDNRGWMYQLAAGYGAQHATGSGWSESRFADARIESPVRARRLNAFAQLQYSNTSVTGGLDYDYVSGRLGLTVGF